MSQAALTPKQFIEKWAAVSANEIAVAQSHFRDLCALLDILAPYDDPTTQDIYRFEQPLAKSGGGAGRADVWHAGKFVWEYKSKGKNLEEAYQQLTLYRSDLGNPPGADCLRHSPLHDLHRIHWYAHAPDQLHQR